MKLLFDQNLSPRLVNRLSDLYPASSHVSNLGLSEALDRAIWDYAQKEDYLIVTKDVDFSEISMLLGYPPKILWIRRGNCSTRDIEDILRTNFEMIKAFVNDNKVGILELL